MTGIEILQDGDHERWEEQGGRRAEYLRLSRRLDWHWLGRAPHEVSVLDPHLGEAFDAKMPGHMQARCGAAHPDLYGWKSAQQIAKALQAALTLA